MWTPDMTVPDLSRLNYQYTAKKVHISPVLTVHKRESGQQHDFEEIYVARGPVSKLIVGVLYLFV